MKNYAIGYSSQKMGVKVLIKSKIKCSSKIMLSLVLFLVFMSQGFKDAYLKDFALSSTAKGTFTVEHYDLKITSGFLLDVNKNISLTINVV